MRSTDSPPGWSYWPQWPASSANLLEMWQSGSDLVATPRSQVCCVGLTRPWFGFAKRKGFEVQSINNGETAPTCHSIKWCDRCADQRKAVYRKKALLFLCQLLQYFVSYRRLVLRFKNCTAKSHCEEYPVKKVDFPPFLPRHVKRQRSEAQRTRRKWLLLQQIILLLFSKPELLC